MKTSEKQISAELDFKSWSELMNTVYADNSNGKWAIIFSVLCCFRQFISKEIGFFPSIFFVGPCGMGKTSIANQIAFIVGNESNLTFNLSTCTDALFLRELEREDNRVIVMDEYSDNSITEPIFQGLKSAFHNIGRAIVNEEKATKISFTKINSTPIIIGHEIPCKDDYSLFNRVVTCEMPYKTFSDSENINYLKLMDNKRHLSRIVLSEILLNESEFTNTLTLIYHLEVERLSSLTKRNPDHPRFRSVALFSAMCFFIEKYTDLQLPFTYDEFTKIACDKIEWSRNQMKMYLEL
jgi:hypothetical protein